MRASISAFGHSRVLEPEGEVLAHAHMRVQGVGLEHHGETAIGGRTRLVTSLPSMAISPDVGRSSPAMVRSSVDLPQPEGPTKTTNSPSSDLQIDVVQHVDGADRTS